MSFFSFRFFCFLLAVLGLLSLPFSHLQKKRILAVASCLFYAAWDYRYLGLLLFVSVVDYVAASRIHRSGSQSTKLAWLLTSVGSNLGLLGYFKYYNFFADNLTGLLAPAGVSLPVASILLPAGISFYTFKTLSYTIDVFRGEIEPCASLADYAMFVTFFPELIAGPIVRASVFLPQMTRPIGPNWGRLSAGASLFLLGFTKKRLIADSAAVVADTVFSSPEAFDSTTVWIGVLAYAVQIYGDFSGYSDMAVGTAKMLGYDLPENFNMPYLAADLPEFWRRWHITLSEWLRDYLYIPLGGNRRGPLRTYFNLAATMLLGGLWHGASWNFVVWGALHGGGLGLHRLYQRVVPDRFRLPRYLSVPLTFLFVILCWVPFRAPSFDVTARIYARMFDPRVIGLSWWPWPLGLVVLTTVLGHRLAATFDRARPSPAFKSRVESLLSFFGFRPQMSPISGWFLELFSSRTPGVFVLTIWLLLLFLFIPTNASPFIYFQF